MEDKLKVIGPTDITEMVKGKTRIILISDYHENYKIKSCKKKKDSILTTDLIENLISKDKNKQWDFYLETSMGSDIFLIQRYYTDIEEMKNNYLNCKKSNSKEDCDNMNFVFSYFASKGCFLKKKCIHENTRFHFIDIRQKTFDNITFFTSSSGNSYFFLNINHFIDKFFKFNDKENLKDTIKIEFLNYLTNLKSLKKLINRDRKKNKIIKQILKSEQRESIYSYFFEKISDYEQFINLLIRKFNKNNINKFSNNIINLLEKFKSLEELTTKINLFYENLETIVDIFFGKDLNEAKLFYKKHIYPYYNYDFDTMFLTGFDFLLSFYVDLYTLGRMFRKFDGKNQENLIVLAGGHHINEYKKFLKSIKFKTKFVSEKENFRCQVIPNIL